MEKAAAREREQAKNGNDGVSNSLTFIGKLVRGGRQNAYF
jgi:hypothetical protein